MTREEALTEIKERVFTTEYFDNSYVDCVDIEALKVAIKTIEQLEPRWTPCSERPPEDDTEVFVYLFDRPSPYIAWVCDGCWFTEDFQVEKENYPKAWMPLPQPYTERGKE